MRPQTPYAPSFLKGTYEGQDYHPEGAHGSGGHAGTEGEIVANGYAISATPEDRHEPEPGQLFARVTIREIRHPAIKSAEAIR